MARGRMINTTIALDPEFNALTMEAQLLFLRTVPHLDRDGLILGLPMVLWATVAPLMPSLMCVVPDAIDEWIAAGFIQRFDTKIGPVLWFRKFKRNQSNLQYDREPASKLPIPDDYERTKDGIQQITSNLLVNSAAEVEVEVEVEVEGVVSLPEEGISTKPAHSRKVVRHPSPYLDARRFTQAGHIPTGTALNPVEVYYERFCLNNDTHRLDTFGEDDLVQLCPDLAKLRDVVTAYSRRNYRPGNVQLILDWYNTGIPVNGHGPPGHDADKEAIKAMGKRNQEEARRTAEKFGKRAGPVRGTIAHSAGGARSDGR